MDELESMGFKRKYLSAEGLLNTVKNSIKKENLVEKPNFAYSWHDCIMSGLAIFGFKFPSLLQFDKAKNDNGFIKRNLRNLYGVIKTPSDTTMRERLDQLDPAIFRKSFKQIFASLQRGKVLEDYKYLDEGYIVSIDGTGQYSSKTISCKNCCEKNHRNGTTTFYHHMLAAVIVSPEKKEVIPFAPEPIIKGDGYTKNDCERNASKRLLNDLRREHPHLRAVIVEDSLSSNFPHLSLIDSLKMKYIIGVKPGDHEYLFDWIKDLKPIEYSMHDDETSHLFNIYENVPLNDTHHDYKVTVIDYKQTSPNGKVIHWTWVTSLEVNDKNVYKIMRAARSRWRIENETFNTLKNQGYNFEHNYGHGYENLCSVMTMLMLLTFLIDQVQQICCKRYQKARKKAGPFKVLYQRIMAHIDTFGFSSWEDLYKFIYLPEERPPPDSEWNIIYS